MWDAISSAISNVPIMYFVYAIALNTILAIIGSLSYKLLFKMQEENLGFLNSFFILHMAQFLNFFAPFKTGALFGKPLITKLIGNMPLTKSIFAVGFENFFSIAWQVTMLPILLLLVGEDMLFNNLLLKITITILFFICVGIVLYKYKWFIPKIIALKRFLPNRINKIALKFGINDDVINDFVNSIPSYFSNKKIIALLILLTAIQAVILPFFVGLSLSFFGIKMGYFSLFSVYWISYVLGRLSFLPSGLGVKDVTMGGLIVGFGIDSGIAIKSVVLFRALTFVPYLIIGGILFLYYGHKYTYKRFFKKDEVDAKNPFGKC